MTEMQKIRVHEMKIDGLSYAQIASELNLSENTVKSFCRRNSLQRTAIEDATNPNSCRFCGKNMVQIPKQKPKKFCSNNCRVSWWHKNCSEQNLVYWSTCTNCGGKFQNHGNRSRRYCSHQ